MSKPECHWPECDPAGLPYPGTCPGTAAETQNAVLETAKRIAAERDTYRKALEGIARFDLDAVTDAGVSLTAIVCSVRITLADAAKAAPAAASPGGHDQP